MKRGIFGIAIWLLVMATPAFAAQKPKSAPKSQPVTKSVKTTTKVQGKSTVKAQGGPKAKTTVKSNPKVKTTTAAAPKTKVKSNAKTASTTTTTSTTITPTTTLSPVQQKLKRNTNLAAKLQTRLPAGTDLMTAASGFRTLGQFVSTVNASHNHNLSFTELKQRIVYDGMSLGQAMKDLR